MGGACTAKRAGGEMPPALFHWLGYRAARAHSRSPGEATGCHDANGYREEGDGDADTVQRNTAIATDLVRVDEVVGIPSHDRTAHEAVGEIEERVHHPLQRDAPVEPMDERADHCI